MDTGVNASNKITERMWPGKSLFCKPIQTLSHIIGIPTIGSVFYDRVCLIKNAQDEIRISNTRSCVNFKHIYGFREIFLTLAVIEQNREDIISP